jgi:hypothetical protein
MPEYLTFKRHDPGASLTDMLAGKSGQFVSVHPDDYRPSDPDDPQSPHLWQVGDRCIVTPFTLGEAQPATGLPGPPEDLGDDRA